MRGSDKGKTRGSAGRGARKQRGGRWRRTRWGKKGRDGRFIPEQPAQQPWSLLLGRLGRIWNERGARRRKEGRVSASQGEAGTGVGGKADSLYPLGEPPPEGLCVLGLELLDELGSRFWRAADRGEVDAHHPVGRLGPSRDERGAVEVGDFRHDLVNEGHERARSARGGRKEGEGALETTTHELRLSVLHLEDGVERNLDADGEEPFVHVALEAGDDLRGGDEVGESALDDHRDGDGGGVGRPGGDSLREDVEGDFLAGRVLALNGKADDVVENVLQLGLVR